jgi:PmbA protein
VTKGLQSLELDVASQRAIELACELGADEAEAWCEAGRRLDIRVYGGELESLVEAEGSGVGLRVLSDGRSAYGCSTDLSKRGIEAVAQLACGVMKLSDPDDANCLPARFGCTRVPGLRSPRFGCWTRDQKIDLAKQVERACTLPSVSRAKETWYWDEERRITLSNSGGFSGAYETTWVALEATALAGDYSDQASGVGLGGGRDPESLDAQEIGHEASRRAVMLVGARTSPTRECAVVFDARVAATLARLLAEALASESGQRGGSPFAGGPGSRVASASLRLSDDGVAIDGFASAPFDAEGSPRCRTTLLEEGRVCTFLFDAASARRAGGQTTANAWRDSYLTAPSVRPTNPVIDPGEHDLSALIERAGEGVYALELSGLEAGVDAASGAFSAAATGLLIKNGQLGQPIRGVTIAGELMSMLLTVEAGKPSSWCFHEASAKAPPLLVADMVVSGSSQL